MDESLCLFPLTSISLGSPPDCSAVCKIRYVLLTKKLSHTDLEVLRWHRIQKRHVHENFRVRSTDMGSPPPPFMNSYWRTGSTEVRPPLHTHVHTRPHLMMSMNFSIRRADISLSTAARPPQGPYTLRLIDPPARTPIRSGPSGIGIQTKTRTTRHSSRLCTWRAGSSRRAVSSRRSSTAPL